MNEKKPGIDQKSKGIPKERGVLISKYMVDNKWVEVTYSESTGLKQEIISKAKQ